MNISLLTYYLFPIILLTLEFVLYKVIQISFIFQNYSCIILRGHLLLLHTVKNRKFVINVYSYQYLIIYDKDYIYIKKNTIIGIPLCYLPRPAVPSVILILSASFSFWLSYPYLFFIFYPSLLLLRRRSQTGLSLARNPRFLDLPNISQFIYFVYLYLIYFLLSDIYLIKFNFLLIIVFCYC